MKPISDEEIKEDIEFLRNIMADPVKFNRWANDLLDRAHRHNVERRRRR
jgi:hypothetical protein